MNSVFHISKLMDRIKTMLGRQPSAGFMLTSWKWHLSFPSHSPQSPKPFSTFLPLIKEAPGYFQACQGSWGSQQKPMLTVQRDTPSLVCRQPEVWGRALNIGSVHISFQCTLIMPVFPGKAVSSVCEMTRIYDVKRFKYK